MLQEKCMDPVNPKIFAVPGLTIPMIFDSPEERAMREGIHKRIQQRYIMRIGREHFKLKRGWMHLQDGMKSKT